MDVLAADVTPPEPTSPAVNYKQVFLQYLTTEELIVMKRVLARQREPEASGVLPKTAGS